MDLLPPQLEPLKNYNQFLLWMKVIKSDGSIDKLPIDKNGMVVDPHQSSSWLTYDDALLAGMSFGDNVGLAFVFTTHDPFFFFDIDQCVNNGIYNNKAAELITMLPGVAVELSTSGTGLHLFGQLTKPLLNADRYKKYPNKSNPGPEVDKFDLYTEARFVALTGDIQSGDLATYSYDDAINAIVHRYLTKSQTLEGPKEWTTTHSDDSAPIEDDDVLIEKMLASAESAASAFGGKATVKDLWEKNISALAVSFPSHTDTKPFDHSAADAALVGHLSFWTGKNCDRIDRLFRRSALFRDKWDSRSEYRYNTVVDAVALCKNTFGTPVKSPLETPLTTEERVPEVRVGYQYLTAHQQLDYFKGCKYIIDLNKIYVPSGGIYDKDRFKAVYGGYSFALDANNDKVTKCAHEAFIASQAIKWDMADGTAFRPQETPGKIIEEEGRILVNTYHPIKIEMRHGDVSPILDHLSKMLPDPRDQKILLSYMAAVVQHPGIKFQWAPVLQGVEGNGKTLYSRILTYAVGKMYTHPLDPKDIGNKFNAWILNKLLVTIDEVHTEHKREVMDALKPLITDEFIPLQGKGADQKGGDNRANFMMSTNHKDAIKKTLNDRRYCIFYTAQQEYSQLIQLGWVDKNGGSSYFSNLYNWLKKEGYAFFTQYLHDFQIPEEYNPAKDIVRAPRTSTTDQVIAFSLGPVEQEIVEAIECGVWGFQGGYISSIQLTRLFEAKRVANKIPQNRRPEMLENLGYIKHPGLKDGRASNRIPSEDGKPVIYVKKDSIQASNLQGTAAVKAYVDAQQGFSFIDKDNPASVFGSS